MISFEYASPRTEEEAIALLNDHGGDTVVLAGGTDTITLLKRDLLTPKRVVDIKNVESMRGIEVLPNGAVQIGALTTLEDVAQSKVLKQYPSLLHIIDGIRSIQVQQSGTIGGDLCHLPNCWYYRNGYGLLGMKDGESLVETGDNRYHAIFNNRGPAKFVSASRFAPSLIAWDAQVRVIGPGPQDEDLLPLDYFFIAPKTASQGVTVLKPGQLISHIWLRPSEGWKSAAYEVLQMEGLDWPLASAAACVEIESGIVRNARVVLGHVAPMPWNSHEAAHGLIGHAINEETAQAAGNRAVASATPLSGNEYKVQIARTAVKRALLRAVDQLEGGL